MSEQPIRTELPEAEYRRRLIPALRKLGGHVTVGDVVAETGLPSEQTENLMRVLLAEYGGHLAVDQNGELLYRFPPSMTKPRSRGEKFKAALQRVARAAYTAFQFLFKVSIMVVLIGYFIFFLVIFVLIVLAAIASLFKDSDSDVGVDIGFDWIFDLLFWFWWVSPPTYSYPYPEPVRRRRQPARKKRNRPFYKDVFAFVFGEEEEKPDLLAEERRILDFIRDHQGRLTAADLVALTGCTLAEADERLLKLMVDYQGDVEVTEEGALVYTFDRLMPTLQQESRGQRQWAYCWEQPEEMAVLNRNSPSTNGWIIFFNLFNLAWASFFTFLLFSPDRWVMEGQAIAFGWPIRIALSIFPLAFSLLFFLIPIGRKIKLNRENARRAQRNRRRRWLQYLYEHQVLRQPAPEPITPAGVIASGANLGPPKSIQAELDRLAADYEGELEITEEGDTFYTFPRLRREATAVEEVRQRIGPEEFAVQEVVYTSEE
jgi:hypothetical protein